LKSGAECRAGALPPHLKRFRRGIAITDPTPLMTDLADTAIEQRLNVIAVFVFDLGVKRVWQDVRMWH
jgi:hypothetical protein